MDGARRRVVSGWMMNIEYEWLMDPKKLLCVKVTAGSTHTHLSHERTQWDGRSGWPRDENSFFMRHKVTSERSARTSENEAIWTCLNLNIVILLQLVSNKFKTHLNFCLFAAINQINSCTSSLARTINWNHDSKKSELNKISHCNENHW